MAKFYQGPAPQQAAFDVLNENIATYNFGSHTLSDLETALASYASNMTNGQFKNVIFTVSPATGIWQSSSYYGTIRRDSNGRYNLFAQPMNGVAPIVTGNYKSGSWSWEELNSKIGNYTDYKNSLIATKASVSSCSMTRIGHIVSFSVAFTVTDKTGVSISGFPVPVTNSFICFAYNSANQKIVPALINIAGTLELVDISDVSNNDSLRIISTYLSSTTA